ncbi:hypothetical protein ACFC60_10185 [Kitasatospora purpeofusca]|uniref:hypothetical protein n=1 Tax=Kitasatospora purpeofusca TaxID=67352 RepID=UPI0035D53808
MDEAEALVVALGPSDTLSFYPWRWSDRSAARNKLVRPDLAPGQPLVEDSAAIVVAVPAGLRFSSGLTIGGSSRLAVRDVL